MPEAPEVLTIAKQFNERLMRRNVLSFHQEDDLFKKRIKNSDLFGPGRFKYANAHGKLLYFQIAGYFVCCGLGMTGAWIIQSASFEKPKHTRAYFKLDKNENLYYTDVRKFGTICFVTDVELPEKIKKLGPSIMWWSLKDTMDAIDKLREKPDENICCGLMNQSIIAGIGNYIKCEALYKSKTDPNSKIKDISTSKFFDIFASAFEVAQESFKVGGNSMKDYVHTDGSYGTFANHLSVYRKTIDPYGNPVERIQTPDGRSTYYVPSVQGV